MVVRCNDLQERQLPDSLRPQDRQARTVPRLDHERLEHRRRHPRERDVPMSKRIITRLLATAAMVVTTITVAIPSTPSFAEPTKADLDKAREEYRRGLALEAANDYEEALAAFKGVANVKSTPQV